MCSVRRAPSRTACAALLLLALASCSRAGSAAPPRIESVQPPVLHIALPPVPADRLALGRPSEFTGDGDDARLSALADSAMRTGDRGTAVAALGMRLRRARMRIAQERLHAGATALPGGGATIAAERTRGEVLRASEALSEWNLVLEALAPFDLAAMSGQERASFERAVEQSDWLGHDAYRAAYALARAEPQRALALLRKVWDANELPRPSDAELAALGAGAIDLLDDRFEAAVREHEYDRAFAIAPLLAREDPLHVGARLALLLKRESPRARGKRGSGARATDASSAQLVSDVLSAAAPMWRASGAAMARLEHLIATHPDAGAAYHIAFALHASTIGLVGECRQALDRLPSRLRARADAAVAADTVAALCAFEGGDAAAFEPWHARAQVARSYSVTARLIASATDDALPFQRHVASAALAQALERGYHLQDPSRLLWLLHVDDVAHDVRQRARERLVANDYPAAVLDTCMTPHSGRATCEQRFEAVWYLQDPDDGEMTAGDALDALASVPGYALDWTAVRDTLDETAWPALTPWLTRASQRMSGPDQLFVTIAAMLRAGQTEEAGAALARFGRLFEAPQRIALRLSVVSIAAGAAPGAVLDGLWVADPFVGTSAPSALRDEEHLARIANEWYPGDDALSAYRRAHAFYSGSELPRAIAGWQALLPQLDAEDRPALAASIAIAQHHLGREQEALATAAEVRVAEPGGLATLLLDAFLHARSGHAAAAHAAHARALLAEPGTREAFHGFMRTLPGVERLSAPELARFVDTLAASNAAAEQVSGAIEQTHPAAPADVIALCGDYDQAAFELGERGVRSAALDRSAGFWLEQRMNESERAADVVAWAKRASSYHLAGKRDAGKRDAGKRDAGQPEQLERWAWFHFLAGDARRARDLMLPEDPLEAGNSHDPLVLLADARARGAIDDELAVAIWKNRERWNRSPLQAVEALQQRALDDAGVQQYLCRLLVDADLHAAALKPCADAWLRGIRNGDLGASVSWLVMQSPDDASSAGLHAQNVFEAPGARKELLGPTWLYNAGLFRLDQDRVPEARALFDAAWRAGFDVLDHGLSDDAATKLNADPPLYYRALVAQNSDLSRGARYGALAMLAFGMADPQLVQIYGKGARAFSSGAGGEAAELGSLVGIALDLGEILNRDLGQGTLTRAQARHVASVTMDQDGPALARLSGQHPDSRLLWLLDHEHQVAQRNFARALPLLEKLRADFPSNATVLIGSVQAYLLAGRNADARSVLEHARSLFPDDARFAQLEQSLAEVAPSAVPALVKTAQAFDVAWQRIPDGAYAGLDPQRRVSPEDQLEVFLPAGYAPVFGEGFHFSSSDGVDIELTSMPRMTRCPALECLAPILAGFERQGMRTLWKRDTALPAAAAAQALLLRGRRVTALWLLPIERNVYLITAGAPVERLEQALPALRMATDSLRFLGSALGARETEAIREQLWSLPKDALRLRARFELQAHRISGGNAQGCPIAGTLAATAAGARADLLADVALSAAGVERRRALLHCARAHAPDASKLGAVALLSEDDALHAFGRAALRAHPQEALAAARAMIEQGYDNPTVADPVLGVGLPPYGALELLLALPDKQRREFSRDLLQKSDKSLHLLGLAAAVFQPGIAPAEILQADIRSAPTTAAVLATLAAGAAPTPAQLSAMRERLARLRGLRDASTRSLARALAAALAAQLEPGDQALLAATAAAALAQAEADTDDALALATTAATHRVALALATPGASGGAPRDVRADEALALSWVAGKKAKTAARTEKPQALDALRDKTLPELLPGGAWFYARLPKPGVFVSLAKQLFDGIDLGGDDDAFWARSAIERLTAWHGGGLLSPGGGLDLRRPIECAQSSESAAFVCSAYVSDARRVREQLGRRPPGSDAGTALTVHVARNALFFPLSIALLPGAPQVAFSFSGGGGAPPSAARLLTERVRTSERIEGHALMRYASLHVYEDRGVLVDHEYYLFLGDRLFVFGGADIARLLLSGAPAGQTLLGDVPAFRDVTVGWTGHGALQGALVYKDELGSFRAAGIAFAPDTAGASFEWRFDEAAQIKQSGALVAALPKGAVARSASSMPGMLGALARRLPLEGVGAGTPPPRWLLAAPGGAAFGWYPEGSAAWEHWALALPWTPALAGMLERHGLHAQAAAPSPSAAGLFATRAGGVVVVASSQALLERPPAGAGAGAGAGVTSGNPVFFASFDPQAASAAFERIAAPAPGEEREDFRTRLAASVARSLRAISIRGEARPRARGVELRGRVDFALSARRPRSRELAKQWLSVRNAVSLPQRLELDDSGRELVYVLEVEDAARFAERAFPRDLRVSAQAHGARRVELRVRPHMPAEPAAFDATRRQAWLRDETGIEPSSPQLKAAALRIAGDARNKGARAIAERVSRWVKQHMRYEITPESVNTTQLLASLRGDCSEFSSLTVALLRALGVPARMQEGLMAADGELVAHVWVRYHDGERFLEIDPTNDPDPVGSGHISASLADIVGPLSLGRFKVLEVQKK